MDSKYLRRRLNLMLLTLAVALEGMMVLYWVAVLEPQVIERVTSTANRLSRSQAQFLVEALKAGEENPESPHVINALEKMLFLKDPETGTIFTLGVEFMANCEAAQSCEGEMSLSRGNKDCEECFITEVPLYSHSTKELLGIARLHNSNEFLKYFKKGVKSMFFTGAGVGLGLVVLAWFALNGIIKKIEKAEKELQERQAQVVHAGRLTAMGEMAAGIAHEINQPLAIIRVAADGLSGYFKKNKASGMEMDAVSSIINQVNRSSAIIENMRSFVRSGRNSPERVALIEPLNAALSFFKEQLRIHGIKLTLEMDDDIPKVRVSPQKFEQIVVNLLSNARYAVDKKEEIYGKGEAKEIRVGLLYESEKKTVKLRVRDNGIGMDTETSLRCQEPFYTTKEVGEGTGIGLSIVNNFVVEGKMEMKIKSAPGEGSLFEIRIKDE